MLGPRRVVDRGLIDVACGARVAVVGVRLAVGFGRNVGCSPEDVPDPGPPERSDERDAGRERRRRPRNLTHRDATTTPGSHTTPVAPAGKRVRPR